MFARRDPPAISRKFADVVWPSMGWKRSTRYWCHRIVRLKDSNYKIAAGLAFGAAISFTPIPGVHALGAALLCILFRVNLMAGLLGTLVGNPWTIPFMWWFSYLTGKHAFIQLGLDVRQMPEHFEWREMFAEVTHEPLSLLAPWLMGGLMVMVFSWPIFYLFFHFIIDHLRSTHHLWKENRIHKEARTITGQLE